MRKLHGDEATVRWWHECMPAPVYRVLNVGCWLLTILTGVLCAVVSMSLLGAASRHAPGHAMVIKLVCMVVQAFLAVAIHEAGHAIAAYRSGMRVYQIRVGPLEMTPIGTSMRMRWRFAKMLKGVGGQVLAFPDPARPMAPAMRRLMAGGPLANLLTMTLVAILALVLTGALRGYLAAFAVLNAGVAFGNMLPSARKRMTDGWQWLQWRRGWPDDAGQLSHIRIVSLMAFGTRSDQLPPALLAQLETLGRGGALMVAYLRLRASQITECWHEVDSIAQDVERIKGEASSKELKILSLLLVWFELECAFSRAVIALDASALLAMKLPREILWHAPWLPYRFAALAAALNGDRETCEQQLQHVHWHAARNPELALPASEARIAEHIRSLIG